MSSNLAMSQEGTDSRSGGGAEDASQSREMSLLCHQEERSTTSAQTLGSARPLVSMANVDNENGSDSDDLQRALQLSLDLANPSLGNKETTVSASQDPSPRNRELRPVVQPRQRVPSSAPAPSSLSEDLFSTIGLESVVPQQNKPYPTSCVSQALHNGHRQGLNMRKTLVQQDSPATNQDNGGSKHVNSTLRDLLPRNVTCLGSPRRDGLASCSLGNSSSAGKSVSAATTTTQNAVLAATVGADPPQTCYRDVAVPNVSWESMERMSELSQPRAQLPSSLPNLGATAAVSDLVGCVLQVLAAFESCSDNFGKETLAAAAVVSPGTGGRTATLPPTSVSRNARGPPGSPRLTLELNNQDQSHTEPGSRLPSLEVTPLAGFIDFSPAWRHFFAGSWLLLLAPTDSSKSAEDCVTSLIDIVLSSVVVTPRLFSSMDQGDTSVTGQQPCREFNGQRDTVVGRWCTSVSSLCPFARNDASDSGAAQLGNDKLPAPGGQPIDLMVGLSMLRQAHSLLFGKAPQLTTAEYLLWWRSYFQFNNRVPQQTIDLGLLQQHGGVCGILAPLQAWIFLCALILRPAVCTVVDRLVASKNQTFDSSSTVSCDHEVSRRVASEQVAPSHALPIQNRCGFGTPFLPQHYRHTPYCYRIVASEEVTQHTSTTVALPVDRPCDQHLQQRQQQLPLQHESAQNLGPVGSVNFNIVDDKLVLSPLLKQLCFSTCECIRKVALAWALTTCIYRATPRSEYLIVGLNYSNIRQGTCIDSQDMLSTFEAPKDIDFLFSAYLGKKLFRIFRFSRITEVFQFYNSSFQSLLQSHAGILGFVFSIILTRGVVQIKHDVDDSTVPLVGLYGHSSQELVNLLLTGEAVTNVFDGDKILDASGGTLRGSNDMNSYQDTLPPNLGVPSSAGITLRGIRRRQIIGYLTELEALHYCEVGRNYKNPLFPLWVVGSPSHFTCMFSYDAGVAAGANPAEKSCDLSTEIAGVFDTVDQTRVGFVASNKLRDLLELLHLSKFAAEAQATLDPPDQGGVIVKYEFVEWAAQKIICERTSHTQANKPVMPASNSGTAHATWKHTDSFPPSHLADSFVSTQLRQTVMCPEQFWLFYYDGQEKPRPLLLQILVELAGSETPTRSSEDALGLGRIIHTRWPSSIIKYSDNPFSSS